MAIARGWYRRRVGRQTRTATHSTAWGKSQHGARLQLSLRTKPGDDDPYDREVLHMEFTYSEAESIIAAWNRYMAQYPEQENA